MYKLTMTELAQNDLDGIVDYIARHLANPIAAGNFLDEVDKCYSYLREDPLSTQRAATHSLKKKDTVRRPLRTIFSCSKSMNLRRQ